MTIKPTDFFGASQNSVLNKPFMHVQDQKAYNVDGGSSVADTWTSRDLNTVILNQIPGASLVSNGIQLPAGTYYIEGASQFVKSGTSYSTSFVGISVGSIIDAINVNRTAPRFFANCSTSADFAIPDGPTNMKFCLDIPSRVRLKSKPLLRIRMACEGVTFTKFCASITSPF